MSGAPPATPRDGGAPRRWLALRVIVGVLGLAMVVAIISTVSYELGKSSSSPSVEKGDAARPLRPGTLHEEGGGKTGASGAKDEIVPLPTPPERPPPPEGQAQGPDGEVGGGAGIESEDRPRPLIPLLPPDINLPIIDTTPLDPFVPPPLEPDETVQTSSRGPRRYTPWPLPPIPPFDDVPWEPQEPVVEPRPMLRKGKWKYTQAESGTQHISRILYRKLQMVEMKHITTSCLSRPHPHRQATPASCTPRGRSTAQSTRRTALLFVLARTGECRVRTKERR
jgi:hypothetical protein